MDVNRRIFIGGVAVAAGLAASADAKPRGNGGKSEEKALKALADYADRVRAWSRLSRDLPLDQLERMIRPATLADLPALGQAILKGKVQGRVVVDVRA